RMPTPELFSLHSAKHDCCPLKLRACSPTDAPSWAGTRLKLRLCEKCLARHSRACLAACLAPSLAIASPRPAHSTRSLRSWRLETTLFPPQSIVKIPTLTTVLPVWCANLVPSYDIPARRWYALADWVALTPFLY